MVSGASPRTVLPEVNSLVVQGGGRPYLVIRIPAEMLPNWVRAGV